MNKISIRKREYTRAKKEEYMDISKKYLEGLSEETLAKVRSCQSEKDLLSLALENGVELTDEQLDMVSGGEVWDNYDCHDLDRNQVDYFPGEE